MDAFALKFVPRVGWCWHRHIEMPPYQPAPPAVSSPAQPSSTARPVSAPRYEGPNGEEVSSIRFSEIWRE